MKAKINFLLFIAGFVLSPSHLALGQTENNDQIIIYQFLNASKNLSQKIQNNKELLGKYPKLTQIKTYLDQNQLTLKVHHEDLILNGQEVTCINTPHLKHVKIQSRFGQLPEGMRRALVLHEWLGLLEISDHHYRVSLEIISQLGSQNQITAHELGIAGQSAQYFYDHFPWQGPKTEVEDIFSSKY